LGDASVLPDVRAIFATHTSDTRLYHTALIGLTHLGDEATYKYLRQMPIRSYYPTEDIARALAAYEARKRAGL
jgi:hypothetical protein